MDNINVFLQSLIKSQPDNNSKQTKMQPQTFILIFLCGIICQIEAQRNKEEAIGMNSIQLRNKLYFVPSS